jgi:predicted XRE-type DNA-binding protein
LGLRSRSDKPIEVLENAPLSRADADAEAKIKVYLARVINGALQDRGLRQKEAARLLQVRQPKISALSNYRLIGFSLERLLNFLNALGWDIQIVVTRASRNTAPGIHLREIMPRFTSGSGIVKE